MKIAFLLTVATTFLTTKTALCKAIEAPLDLITLDDLTPEDRKQLELLNQEAARSKRSGSGDILSTIKAAVGQAIAKKIGQFAKSSASASARFSSGISSSGHYEHPHPHPPEEHEQKSFDWWSLKKSILNTLLQAVKAIKGGVIAVKGQLIKGGGHLISAKGRLLSSKGEAITNLGKQIASSAVLVPHPGLSHSAPSAHEGYVAPHISHYGPPPSSPSTGYGAPSAPSSGYIASYHHDHDHSNLHLPHGSTSEFEDTLAHGSESAGLLILKKIPHKRDHDAITAEESNVPEFKPLEPPESSEYSLTSILGKFMSASSSWNPDQPKLFGNKPHAHLEPHESHKIESISVPDKHEVPKPLLSGIFNTPKEEPAQITEEQTSEFHSPDSKPLFHNPDALQSVPPLSASNLDLPSGAIPSFMSATSLNTDVKLPPGVTVDDLPNIESFGPYPGPLPEDFVAQFGSPEDPPMEYTLPHKPLVWHSFTNHLSSKHVPHGFRKSKRPPHSHPAYDSHGVSVEDMDTAPYPSTKVVLKSKVRHRTRAVPNRLKPPQTYDLVKSIGYELGPNGPMKI